MADDVCEGIDNALNLVVNMERSVNMKTELKQTIFETVSSLRNLFSKLNDNRNRELQNIRDLEAQAAAMKAELEEYRKANTKIPRAPSLSASQEPPSGHDREVAPPDGRERKLYSQALRKEGKPTRFKITITSKESQTSDTVKEILKSKINPTEIKVGINNFKALRNGKILIEKNTEEEMETLGKVINTKCGDKLETHIHKLRNPRLAVFNIPDDINTDNFEDTLMAQNPDLNLAKGGIKAKFTYETIKHTRNLVVEVGAQTRKQLLQTKIKLGWLICNTADYVVANRCFICSRFNNKHSYCRGEVTCPLCAGKHSLKECSAAPSEYKCINCVMYSKYNQNKHTCTSHSSLNKKCPSLQAVLEKYRRNTDY
jgi:hypothetical protein